MWVVQREAQGIHIIEDERGRRRTKTPYDPYEPHTSVSQGPQSSSIEVPASTSPKCTLTNKSLLLAILPAAFLLQASDLHTNLLWGSKDQAPDFQTTKTSECQEHWLSLKVPVTG